MRAWLYAWHQSCSPLAAHAKRQHAKYRGFLLVAIKIRRGFLRVSNEVPRVSMRVPGGRSGGSAAGREHKKQHAKYGEFLLVAIQICGVSYGFPMGFQGFP